MTRVTMWANIVMQYWHLQQWPTTDTTDNGGDFGCGNIDLEAVVEVFDPAVVIVVVVPAAVVEALAGMEAWVLLLLQMVVWRYWHWRQCHKYRPAVLGNTRHGVVAVNGDFGADDRMTGIKVWHRQW